MRQALKQLFLETDGLETVEYAFLAVCLGLVSVVFLPNSEETINRTFEQYVRVLFSH